MSRRLTTPADLEEAIDWRLNSESGSVWTFRCAKQAQAAKASGAVDVFWGAGLEVLQAYRASQRGRVEREGDALTRLLVAFFSNNPGATPSDAYDHCAVLADLRASPVVDFAQDGGFVFEPEPGAALVEIGREACMRRARRALKKAQSDAGHEHVHVRLAA